MAGSGLPNNVWVAVDSAKQLGLGRGLDDIRGSQVDAVTKVTKLLTRAETALNDQVRTDEDFRRSNPEYGGETMAKQQSELRRDLTYYKGLLDNARKSDVVVEGNLQCEATKVSYYEAAPSSCVCGSHMCMCMVERAVRVGEEQGGVRRGNAEEGARSGRPCD